MGRAEIPIEDIMSLHRQGVPYREVAALMKMEYRLVKRLILSAIEEEKKRRIVGQPSEPVKKRYGAMTIYYLPPEEIERRYGKPGACPTKYNKTMKTDGYPDMGEKNKRHFARNNGFDY